MTKIKKINPNYDHTNLVNSPPFITNYPLLEHRVRIRKEIIGNEKERLQNEVSKYKAKNAFIWSWIIGTLVAITLPIGYAYKKIKAALF